MVVAFVSWPETNCDAEVKSVSVLLVVGVTLLVTIKTALDVVTLVTVTVTLYVDGGTATAPLCTLLTPPPKN